MAHTLPQTQMAVAIVAKRAPLASIPSPVHAPQPGQVLIRVLWTASTPLDLHRADGGLLITSYPVLLGGGGIAGKVVAVGSGSGGGDGGDDLKGLRVNDEVMAFAFRGDREANHQEYVTVPAYLVSKIPAGGMSMAEAVTIPVNLVTVFHTATQDLELELPWPLPPAGAGWRDEAARRKKILVWGASSSVGLFALQVFRHWGYTDILAVSSGRHHEHLKSIGATAVFDYTKPGVVDEILRYAKGDGGQGDAGSSSSPQLPYIMDCIGSARGTLEPLSRIAQPGSRVAVMLPVIIKDATDEEEPEYEMDVSKVLPGQWADGVQLRGVRTHFYLENEFYKEKLQPEIIPKLIEQGAVKPNNYRIVEGLTTRDRAQNALSLLRDRAVSGERLVWRVAEAEE